MTGWALPEPGDIVWCVFPELPDLEPGPKPRPALVVTVPVPLVAAVTPKAPAPEVVAEARLAAILPPPETADTPSLLAPAVESVPHLMVIDPVPCVRAVTADELAPVVVTVGQPPTLTEPVGLEALAMMPAPLAVVTAPVLTVTSPRND